MGGAPRARADPAPPLQAGHVSVPGTLRVLNSLDAMAKFDWAGAFDADTKRIWGVIAAARDAGTPPPGFARELCRFLLVVHADLKTYKFTHWAAFPALLPPAAFAEAPGKSLRSLSNSRRMSSLCRACDAAEPAAAWCVTVVPHSDLQAAATVSPLEDLWAAPPDGAVRWLAFADPSGTSHAPGWPLRNLLLALAVIPGIAPGELNVACMRRAGGVFSESASRRVTVAIPALSDATWPHPAAAPAAVGWEAPAPGKRTGPRRTDLGASLDPARLAADALTLNLRLMRWRAAADLDPGVVSRAKCLLLGAGTLGCAVARGLLAWGVTRITFVDAGRVSYSNPARQSLFTHADAHNGGSPKATTAAAALKAIHPGVDATGVDLTIPMPGHPPADDAAVEFLDDVAKLQELVRGADVVFLLTDTRESRWLPTLLAAESPSTLAITAAIGFDTYVVMRHGVDGQGGKERLGCYFCADVVAPTDSTRDRALDQQCTVSRPGLAPLAASLAVELAAAGLAHPAGARAPAPAADPDADAAPLGPVPHQLRGRLGAGFQQGPMAGGAFAQCSACSRAVRAAWRERGAALVLAAARDPGELERVSGLAELHATMEAMALEEKEEGNEEGGADAGPSAAAGDDDDWLEL